MMQSFLNFYFTYLYLQCKENFVEQCCYLDTSTDTLPYVYNCSYIALILKQMASLLN